MRYFRCVSAILLCCIMLPATSAPAGITNTGLRREGAYQQLGPTTFVPFRHNFEAWALSSFTNQYESVSLTFAGPRSPAILSSVDPFGDYEYVHPMGPGDAMVTQADLYAQYPLGDYTFTGNGYDGGSFLEPNPFVFNDSNSGDLFPSVPLGVSAASFAALQAINPFAELTIDIIAELNAVGNLNNFSANIVDLSDFSQVLRLESDLPLSQWTIPAGTLIPNHIYQLYFYYFTNDSTIGATITNNSIVSLTFMEIRTVPEPTTCIMLITGLLSCLFAGALNRRRIA